MHTRNITFELYQGGFDEADGKTLFDALTHLAKNTTYQECGSGNYELTGLKPHPKVVRGAIRKFDHENIPHAGKLGGKERTLDLDRDEGLVNKSYFSYHKNENLFIWQRNTRNCWATTFAEMLSDVLGATVSLNPVINHQAIQQMMDGKTTIRSLELSFSGNPNAVETNSGDFSDHAMMMLAGANGYASRVVIRGNGHSKHSSDRFLDSKVATVMRKLVKQNDVKAAKIRLENMTHPIDLVSDKVVSIQPVEMDGRYPIESSIQTALSNVHKDYRAGRLG